VAIVALFLVMVTNIQSGQETLTITRAAGSVHVASRVLLALAQAGFWGVCIYLIWRRPRPWGFRIGLFHGFVLLFQIFLWQKALASPVRMPGMIYNSWNFALWELPLGVAALCCILLRWYHPQDR
jgi:hypothetical protein